MPPKFIKQQSFSHIQFPHVSHRWNPAPLLPRRPLRTAYNLSARLRSLPDCPSAPPNIRQHIRPHRYWLKLRPEFRHSANLRLQPRHKRHRHKQHRYWQLGLRRFRRRQQRRRRSQRRLLIRRCQPLVRRSLLPDRQTQHSGKQRQPTDRIKSTGKAMRRITQPARQIRPGKPAKPAKSRNHRYAARSRRTLHHPSHQRPERPHRAPQPNRRQRQRTQRHSNIMRHRRPREPYRSQHHTPRQMPPPLIPLIRTPPH